MPKIPPLDDYPDLGPPEVMPEGYKTLKALPGHKAAAPKIRWGNHFEPGHPEEMPDAWKLARAQKVADAMNHAADVAQKRVSELIEIANRQEEQLQQAKVDFENQRQTMIITTERHNADQQARLQEMMTLKSDRARLVDALHLLLADNYAHLSTEFVADVMAGRWTASMEERKSIAIAKREVQRVQADEE